MGRSATNYPARRSLTDPAAREHVARVWGISPEELPAPGYTRGRDHERHPQRRDQRAAVDLLQSAGFAARRQLHARGAGKTRVLRGDRLLSFGDGGTTRMWCWRAACRRKKRASPPTWKRASSTFRRLSTHPVMLARTPPIICDLARRLGRGEYFPFNEPREIFEELRLASQRRLRRLLRHHLRKDRPANGSLLALPYARPSGHAASV